MMIRRPLSSPPPSPSSRVSEAGAKAMREAQRRAALEAAAKKLRETQQRAALEAGAKKLREAKQRAALEVAAKKLRPSITDKAREALEKVALRGKLAHVGQQLAMRQLGLAAGSASRAVLERLQTDAARRARLGSETQPWRVEWGQTLTGIASTLQAQGVQGTVPEIIAQICELNGITNPDLIYAGSTLQVPAPGATSSTPTSPAIEAVEQGEGPAVTPSSPGVGEVPYISQMASEGTEDDWNASSNCGPTSMAMIARAFGFGEGMSDGALVNSLGNSAGVGAAGTGYAGIMTMASSLGLESQSNPGSNVAWIDEQLAQGNLVAANGNRSVTLENESPPYASGTASGGHWIVVCGKTADGNYIVKDPSTTCSVLTPAELSRFLSSNAHGGYAVSVSPP